MEVERWARERSWSDQLKPSPLGFPPVLTSLSARAPKLSRRANGDVGPGNASPSSMAFSSMLGDEAIEAEPLLEALSRLAMKGEGWLGDPDRPTVERDMRRRCCA